MEGRFPNAILMALARPRYPDREDELNKWIDGTHFPDLQSTGLLTNATRFVNVDPQPDQPKYVNIYEIYVEDVEEARKSFATLRASLVDAGRMGDLSITEWRIMPRIGSTSTAAAGKSVKGLLINSQNCKDPASEVEFSDWYSNVHIPDIFESGFFHSAYRYENDNPGGFFGKYLNVYETDLDAVEASNGVRSQRTKWEEMGHTNDLGQVTLRLLVRPMHPKS
ncbi:MAG: hypothetical protein C1O27_000292 [Chloroflexi bacterium]|jgi:hypothetical protein|nr:MAG: hypothetical protein C1O27_000292 [Chloroflexota bacterium]